jgi:hypothetical protein
MMVPGARRFVRTARTSAYAFAAAACAMVMSVPASAAQVQAYVIFEVAASANVIAVVEKLRSTSLGNCLQLIIGSHARVIVAHVACDEAGADTRYLNQALIELSRAEGVARATTVSIKHGAD